MTAPLYLAAWLAVAGAVPAAAEAGPFASLPMGRCVGSAGPETPPAGVRPYPVGSDAVSRQAVQSFAVLGYKPDPAGRLVRQDGGVLTVELAEWMSEPEDFSRVRVPESLWMGLMRDGYRLDETSCLMKGPRGPVTRYDYEAFSVLERRGLEMLALEGLKAKLMGLDPAAPVPEAVREQMRTVEKAGVALPRSVAGLLSAPGARVGALSASVDEAYVASTRFFDGQRQWGDLVKGSLPPVAGVTARRPTPPAMEPEEQRLGRLIAAEVERSFARTDVGRELLDRFRGKDGKVALPPILVLKATQRSDDRAMPGAFWDFANGTMVLNHWQAMSSVLARVPPAERERRAREFADPAKLRRYLEEHADAREELVGDISSLFYHEFIHAWQSRRASYDLELERGNVPSTSPLVKEHEAYREQCRYEFSLAFRDPEAVGSGYMPLCLGMLKDYDEFRDGISRSYLGSYAGTQELPDVVRAQKARESTARRLMGEGLYQKALQAFKLAGMFQGDEALRDLQLDSSQRERKFLRERLPEIRRRVVSELIPELSRRGRPELGLMLLNNLPFDEPGLGQARRAWLPGAEEVLIRKPRTLSLEWRFGMWNAVGDEHRALGAPFSKPLAEAYARDVREEVRALAAQADKESDPHKRAELRSRLKAWAAALPSGDPLRRRYAPGGSR